MTFTTLLSSWAVLLCVPAVLGLTIISKSEWGGRAAKNKSLLSIDLDYAVVHHTAGNYCTNRTTCSKEMRSIQDYHQNALGWDDIGYNFLIGGDGNVYEGRGWEVMGAHASGWNAISLGISFMGNYNNYIPTVAQIEAANELLASAVLRRQIKDEYILYGHRQVGATECPGNYLFKEIQTWPHWKVRKDSPLQGTGEIQSL